MNKIKLKLFIYTKMKKIKIHMLNTVKFNGNYTPLATNLMQQNEMLSSCFYELEE